MVSFFFDASLGKLVAFVLRDGRPIWKYESRGGKAQGSTELVLAYSQATSALQDNFYKCFDHVIAGCGPGSFTGIKVSMAFARGLSRGGASGGVGFFGTSSLVLLLLQLRRSGRDVDALYLRATTERGAVAYFDLKSKKILLRDVDLREEKLKINSLTRVAVLGAWAEFDKLAEQTALRCEVLEEASAQLLLIEAVAYAINQEMPNEFVWDLRVAKPQYLRASTAEESLQLRGVS